jgi:hypothetical protein
MYAYIFIPYLFENLNKSLKKKKKILPVSESGEGGTGRSRQKFVSLVLDVKMENKLEKLILPKIYMLPIS